MQARRTVMLTFAAVVLALTASTSFAQSASKPLVVYANGMGDGWQSWSWATVQMDVPVSDIKAIKVEGAPWTALLLHHDAFSTAAYSKVTFFINGGVDGGQTLLVKLFAGGKAIDANFQIQPKAKTWTKVEVPLSAINGANTTVDSIALQCGPTPCQPYYVNLMQFE